MKNMNWKIIIPLLALSVVGTSIGLNYLTASEAVSASVEEINHNPEKFMNNQVEITAKVSEWTEKNFTVYITAEEYNFSSTKSFSHKFLLLQDLNTSAVLFVVPVKDVPKDFISLDDIITVKGFLKDPLDNSPLIQEQFTFDKVFIATSLQNAQNEILNLVELRKEFRLQQMQIRQNLDIERVDLTVLVQNINVIDFNVTVSSENYYNSKIVTQTFLVVEDKATNMNYFINTHFRHRGLDIPADFVKIGEEIKIDGVLRGINSTQLQDKPILAIFNSIDGIIIPISITNSSGETIQLIQCEKKPMNRFNK